VKTKSAGERYILSRKRSTIGMVMSGRRAQRAGPQFVVLLFQKRSGSSGRWPLGWLITAATTRSGARSSSFQMNGPPMQLPSTRNLSMPR
jgi:hypothetical protein